MKPIAALAGLWIAVSVAVASPPEIPETPAAVEDLVYARQFTLDEGFKHIWCKVDKALVVPRAIAMPVLYVGDKLAERLNHGHKSGYLIAIAPGKVDLTQVPIWFGTPRLPERVDTAAAQAERALAENAGIKPFPKEKVEAALAKGGEPIQTTDKSALLRDQVAELILEYSPDEKHLADGFRLPVVTKRSPANSDEE